MTRLVCRYDLGHFSLVISTHETNSEQFFCNQRYFCTVTRQALALCFGNGLIFTDTSAQFMSDIIFHQPTNRLVPSDTMSEQQSSSRTSFCKEVLMSTVGHNPRDLMDLFSSLVNEMRPVKHSKTWCPCLRWMYKLMKMGDCKLQLVHRILCLVW